MAAREVGTVGFSFAGVRNYTGSCVCLSYQTSNIPRGVIPLTQGLSTQRFSINTSNVVYVYTPRAPNTSNAVHVFGTSNDRTRVYNGNVHYITR